MQATPGKLAFGIEVTDLAGARIGLGRAIARYFAVLLSYLTLCIGFALAGWTRRRQALHDLICGTLVVNRAASSDAIAACGTVMPLTGGVLPASCRK